MKQYVKKIQGENGVTLIEVLLGLTITIFFTSILYGALSTGIKAYEKIGIEWKMRDEADLVITQIQESLYKFKIDGIEEFETSICPKNSTPKGTCISIINDKEIKIDNSLGAVTQFDLFSKKSNTDKLVFKVDGSKIKFYQTDSTGSLNQIMETDDRYDYSKSRIYASCTSKSLYLSPSGASVDVCKGVTINVKIIVDNDTSNTKHEDDLFYNQLALESIFGF